MGFLPFVNQGGKRVVRWHRLALVWLFVSVACTAGTAAASYLHTGDAWHYWVEGMVAGILCAAAVTVRGFTVPVESLPSGS